MVKAYLRYVADQVIGLIAGHTSNILFLKKGMKSASVLAFLPNISPGNLVIAAANEIVLLINPRTSNTDMV